MSRLHILGPAEIRDEKGELEHSFLAGPKRLALLSFLLLNNPGKFHRRDSLLPLFWPEQDQKSARNALSNMLYHIRKTLGTEVIENRGAEEVRINPDALWADTIAFRQAYRDKDYFTVVKLYRGELLKGFYVTDISSEFGFWLEEERSRFQSVAIEGCIGLSEKKFDEGDPEGAITFARKASSLDPYSQELQIRLITFLHQIGLPKAALNIYEKHAKLLLREYGDEPDIHLKELAEEVKSRMQSSSRIPDGNVAVRQKNPEPSIAVLPFETLGLEKATAFTEAIYGDILTRLSQVSDLFVTSRTTSQHFSQAVKQLPQIARDLRVTWILTGEVQEKDARVKVSVRLINALEDRHIWAEIYERKLTAGNLFNIQSEITQKITQSLKMRLSRREEKAIRQIPTDNLEAFRLQAFGRWNLDQRSKKGMQLAEKYFRQAISLDPDYAEAWLGLADALSLLHDYGYKADGTDLPEAKKAALEALRLDPTLAEAYSSLGLLNTTLRNGKEAIESLKKAVELRPSNADAHAWLCWILLLTGDSHGALESARTAVSYNPLSQESISNLALSLLSIRDYEGALREANRVLEVQPDFTTGILEKGVALYHLGKYEQASEVLRDLSVSWAGNGPLITSLLCCLRSGKFSEAEILSDAIREDDFAMGLFLAAKGDLETAFENFHRMKSWNYWEMLSIFHYYPDLLDPIRENPRFGQVLSSLYSIWDLPITPAPQFAGSPNFHRNKTQSLPEKSIAVLPFQDLNSQDPRFSYGLQGDILSSLSREKNLQVIFRTSANYYEGSSKTLFEIGKELNVSWILEGEVSQSKEDITVILRLFEVETKCEVWTETYWNKLTAENLFLLLERLPDEILRELEVHSPDRRIKYKEKTPTHNLHAYRLYIQGRNCLDQRSENALYQGLDCFQGAIDIDPDYALAWSGLADALSLLYYYGLPFPKNTPGALEAAKKAVDLDTNLGEARASLGIVFSTHQNGSAGYKELQKALDLAPGYAEALIWFAWVNLVLNRPENALTAAQKALKLNPLAPAFRVYLSDIYLANGEFEKALTEAKRAREINPEYGLGHFMEGLAFYHTKRFSEAISAFQNALAIIPVRGTPNHTEIKTALAFSYYALGDRQWGLEFKEQIFGRIDPFPMGMLQALYGELDQAFESFSRVQDWTSFSTEFIRYFFPESLAALRDDNRFQELISHVNNSWGLTSDGKINYSGDY